MSKQLIILLDMDEVITDFIGAACALHGHTRQQMEQKRQARRWDICEPLGVTPEQFWAPIHDRGANFWATLQKLPWADELCATIDSNYDWYITTSPSQCPTSYIGKLAWIEANCGVDFNYYFITPHKHMLASYNRVLIDDREDNINKFIQHGGQGIIFPSQGNSLYNMSSDPLPYVFQELEKLRHAL